MRSLGPIGAAVLLLSLLSSPHASAARPDPEEPPGDSLDVLSRVQSSLSGDVYVARPCNPNGYYPIPGAGGEIATVVATGTQISVRCKNGSEYKLAYAELQSAGIVDNGGYYGKHPCIATSQIGLCLLASQLADKYVALKFLGDIKMLARTRDLRSAAAGALMANAGASDSGGLGEIERRAQVQAEAHLNNNRLIAAARVYRDALRQRPGWAQGYYNLALVYGSLELYAESIVAMRRYLQVAPGAEDARAAQDQVYTWETFLPTGPLALAMQE